MTIVHDLPRFLVNYAHAQTVDTRPTFRRGGWEGPGYEANPNPDIPAQPAVGVAIAVLNKMVDDTDNQKKVENAENETALCSTRYT